MIEEQDGRPQVLDTSTDFVSGYNHIGFATGYSTWPPKPPGG
jgi:hypothetical protein